MDDVKPSEPLLTAQFIIALCGLAILALTLIGVFLIKDLSPLQGTIAGSVVSGIMGAVMGFFFGSSQGSQAKDAMLAAKPAPATPDPTHVATVVAAPTSTPMAATP